MSETITIACDFCSQDITYTGNSTGYRIVLKSETLRPSYMRDGHDSGFVTDVYISDPLPKSAHFCGMSHLEAWIENDRMPFGPSIPNPSK